MQRDRVRRGETSPNDRLDVVPYAQMLHGLKSAGLTWHQIGVMVGMDRRGVQRVVLPDRAFVTRGVAERIALASQRVAASADPAAIAAVLVPRDHARWMVGALLARGWTSEWIGHRIGWQAGCSYSDVKKPKVHIETFHRIEEVFRDHHYLWGPSRKTAVQQWRYGRFPADCYDWEREVPDHRPIPGSLHPDLVIEAATYSRPDRVRTNRVLRAMRGWGQWPSGRCADTSMRNWLEWQGLPVEDRSGIRDPWCCSALHDHGLPAAWKAHGSVQ